MNKNVLLLITYFLLLPRLFFCSTQAENDKKDQAQDIKKSPVCATSVNNKNNKTQERVINLFCGRGCIPCNKAAPIVNAVAKKYNFKLNTYEVWYNDKNRELLLSMAKERNTAVNGVPVVIIGNDVYLGVEKISNLEELIQKHLK